MYFIYVCHFDLLAGLVWICGFFLIYFFIYCIEFLGKLWNSVFFSFFFTWYNVLQLMTFKRGWQ